MFSRTEFKNWLILNGRKDKTVETHLWNLNQIIQHCTKDGSVGYDLFTTFLIQKKERKLKNTYINHFIKTLNVYLKWLEKQDIEYDKKLNEIKYLPEEFEEKSIFTYEELKAFLELPPTIHCNHQNYLMWTMYFECLARLGFRPHELSNLKINEVNIGRNTIVVTGKTGFRELPLPDSFIQKLKDYLAICKTEYLFMTKKNEKHGIIDSVAWTYQFRTRLKRLGQMPEFARIDKRPRLSCYSLRHNFGDAVSNATNNIRLLQQLMGHKKIESTLRYVHPTLEQKRAVVRRIPINSGNDPSSIILSVKETLEAFKLEERVDIHSKLEYTNDHKKLKFEMEVKEN